MQIKTFVAGPVQANNYLVYDEQSKEAVLIDCSDYVQGIIDIVQKENLNVKYILLTHGHFDHVLGINAMKEALNTKAYVHEGDAEQVAHTSEIMMMFGLPFNLDVNPKIDGTLKDIENLTFGSEKIEIIETSGHTEGCVCYKIGDVLFSGDTLFQGSVGRTDLPGGDFSALRHSIKDVLFNLDENITVFPGHGDKTTIAYEKKFNDIVNY